VSVVPPVTPGDGAVREERRRSSGPGCAQAHLPGGNPCVGVVVAPTWANAYPCILRFAKALELPTLWLHGDPPVDMADGVMPVLQTCQDVPLQAVAMLETGAPAHMYATAMPARRLLLSCCPDVAPFELHD